MHETIPPALGFGRLQFGVPLKQTQWRDFWRQPEPSIFICGACVVGAAIELAFTFSRSNAGSLRKGVTAHLTKAGFTVIFF